MRRLVKINPREMNKSFCRLLLKGNHTLVANYKRLKYAFFTLFAIIKFSQKSGFIVSHSAAGY